MDRSEAANFNHYLFAPMLPLLISVLSAAWHFSRISELASGRPVTEVCALEQRTEAMAASCNTLILAAAGTALSLLLAFLTFSCFGLFFAAKTLAWRGDIPLASGCKLGYWPSLVGSYANLVLYPVLVVIALLLTLFRLVGVSYPEFDFVVVVSALLGSLHAIWKVLDDHPPAVDLVSVSFHGKAEAPDLQPGLFAILQRVSDATHCPIPDRVIYGLEPTIDCTRRPVNLDGTEIRGLTLYVSLPLCRLLSEAELTALITIHLLRCELVPPDWEAWMINHCSKWHVVRKSRYGSNFAPLWRWMQEWDAWFTGLILIGMQRAAVVAGPTMTAAAIAIRSLAHERWATYVALVQSGLRHGTLHAAAEPINLSERFALKMTERADKLAVAYLSPGENGLPGSSLLSRLVHADPAEVTKRIVTGPADRASDCLMGFERLEVELSRQQIRRIFFTSPEALS